jgi:excisionase family DNA binding protein
MLFKRDDAVEPLLVDTVQAARMLSLHRNTIYRLVREGKLRAVKVYRDYRFSLSELERFARDAEPPA